MSSESVQDLLNGLNKASVANNVYIALDHSSSVNQVQYSLAKIVLVQFLKLMFSLKPSFYKTSVIHYDATPTQAILNQVTLDPILKVIYELKQIGGTVNLVNALTNIKTLADQVQGRKVIFLFTTGEAMDRTKILELTSSGIDIVCFLILENGQAKKNELAAILGNQKVILLPNQQTAQNYFDGLTITGSEVPQISIKNLYSSAATLNLRGIENYQSLRIFIKTSKSPSPREINVSNSREITINLQPEIPRHFITVQGIKPNVRSEVSNELVVNLPKVHPITKKIQNSNTIEELRNFILRFQVPEPLRRAGIESFNISLFGDMGNGKSSAINSALTCKQEANVNKNCCNAPIGTGEMTLTRDLKKYWITNVLNIFDRYGTQFTDDNNHTELENFVKGRHLDGFRQGGKQNPQENDRFKMEASLYRAPHLIIYIVDIKSAENDDSIKKFGEITQYLKQEHGIPIIVGLTKLDKLQENGNNVLDESELGEALENDTVKKFIQKYAKKAELSEHDILPVFNYTGPFEGRSQIKDAYTLVLLDAAIQRITEYFQRYIVLNVIDQNEGIHCFLLENFDISLEYFSQHYLKKVPNNQSFRRVEFFSKENKIISDDKWTTTYLNDIEFNPTVKDGFQIRTIKIHKEKEKEKTDESK